MFKDEMEIIRTNIKGKSIIFSISGKNFLMFSFSCSKDYLDNVDSQINFIIEEVELRAESVKNEIELLLFNLKSELEASRTYIKKYYFLTSTLFYKLLARSVSFC
jgi:hypothetical protein